MGVKHGKKYKDAYEKIQAAQEGKSLSLSESIARVKDSAVAKFDETLTVDINLGIDPQQGDQVVRGSVLLPHGTGKKVRVLAFVKGDKADEATKAGADYVGLEDVIEKIKSGWLEFDYAVATPDVMGKVGQIAKILGPRGLLPNKKVGTVTFDVGSIVGELKKGRTFFRNDKSGLLHFAFGKASFSVENLEENLRAFSKALSASRPAATKGVFIKKMTISSTMGPGLCVAVEEVI